MLVNPPHARVVQCRAAGRVKVGGFAILELLYFGPIFELADTSATSQLVMAGSSLAISFRNAGPAFFIGIAGTSPAITNERY
jgi:hypothetical protein